jgi:hypothetical protein
VKIGLVQSGSATVPGRGHTKISIVPDYSASSGEFNNLTGRLRAVGLELAQGSRLAQRRKVGSFLGDDRKVSDFI